MRTRRQTRDAEREALEREIAEAPYAVLLQELQVQAPSLRGFRDWQEVCAFMQDGAAPAQAKDDILGVLLIRGAAGGSRWRNVLMALLWPDLRALARRCRRWDPDPEELWQDACSCFLETLSRIDLDRRRTGLAKKILNDTAHRLHDRYRAEWKRRERERSGERPVESLPGMSNEALFL